MAAPSPSEFLTFFRQASRSTVLRSQRVSKPLATRPFSISAVRTKDAKIATEEYPDSEHATDKQDKLDVQSHSSAKGREDRASDKGGQATRQKDERNSAQKAKEEFPESPVQIGMQDERGGKGHS